MREWLYLHGFIDTKPGVYVEELNKDELIKLAQTYKKYMLSDIQTWLADTEKDYQPWITKGEQRKNKADEWINDTFFVGINNWSKDKLREFLDVRKVSYSIFTTKHQLIELVKKHKFDPIHVETYAWVVDDVSTDSIKQWLKDQGQQIEGSRQDLVSAFQKQFEGLKNGASNLYNNIELQIRFYTPDINGYKHYLEKNLDPKEYEKLTEDQIQKGFEVVQEYYKLGSDAAKENFDKAKFSAADALDQIEESSYAYSLEFLRGAEKGKNNIAAFIKDAHISSKNYVNSLTQKLSQNIDELQSGALDRLTRWWYGAQATYDNRVDAANQVVLDVSDEVKNYQEKLVSNMNRLNPKLQRKVCPLQVMQKMGTTPLNLKSATNTMKLLLMFKPNTIKLKSMFPNLLPMSILVPQKLKRGLTRGMSSIKLSLANMLKVSIVKLCMDCHYSTTKSTKLPRRPRKELTLSGIMLFEHSPMQT